MGSKEYILAKVSVNIVVRKDDQVLLVQQARPERVYGRWSLPGGKVDVGESFDTAVRRELLEETGLKAIDIERVGIIHDAPETTVKHIFAAELETGEFKYNKDELLDVGWHDTAQILSDKLPLRGEWVKEAIGMQPSRHD